MNPLDWALAALLVYSTVKAFLQGFFREVFSLTGLVLGLLLAAWFYSAAAARLTGLITSPPIAQFVAFLGILALTMVACSVAGSSSTRQLRPSASAFSIASEVLPSAFYAVR